MELRRVFFADFETEAIAPRPEYPPRPVGLALIAPGAFLWTTFQSQSIQSNGGATTAYDMVPGLAFALVENIIYTFNVADASKAIQLYYTYSTTATGNTLAVTNQLMGNGTLFSLNAVNYNPITGNYLNMTFPAVQCFKLGFPMKLDDFTLSPLEFAAQDDGNGNLFTMTMTQ